MQNPIIYTIIKLIASIMGHPVFLHNNFDGQFNKRLREYITLHHLPMEEVGTFLLSDYIQGVPLQILHLHFKTVVVVVVKH